MRLITCALLLCAVIMVHIPNLCDSCMSSKVILRTYEVESGSSEHSYQKTVSTGGSDVKITVNRHVTVEGDGGGLDLIHDLQKKGILSLSHTLELGGSGKRSKHVHSSKSKHVHSSSGGEYGHSSKSKHVRSSSKSKCAQSLSRSKQKRNCKRCKGKSRTDWNRRRMRERVESVMCPGIVSYTTDHFRRVILDTHNRFRSTLALGDLFNPKSGQTLRKANSMLRLNYGCALDHRVLTDVNCERPPRKFAVPGYCDPAVNVYWSKSRDPIAAVKEAMNYWWDDLQRRPSIEQIQNLFYSHSGICNMAPIGSDLTTDVACGTDDCGDKTLVVCRYEFIKKLKNGMKWYNMGPTCRQCQNRWGARDCQDGLCV